MAFDSEGFAKAAKGLGYSDDEIKQVSGMVGSMPVPISLQQDRLNLENSKIKLNQLMNDPLGLNARAQQEQQDIQASGLKDIADKARFNTINVSNAKNILDLMEQKNAGKLDDATYNSRLKVLASKQASDLGFGVGGKVLSEGEKALLQPQMINFANSKTVSRGSWPQRFWGGLTGAPIPEVTKNEEVLKDSPQEIANKMQSIISSFGNDEDKKKYLKAMGIKDPEQVIRQTAPQYTVGGFAGNVVNNARDVANGVLNIPKNVIDYEKGQMSKAASGNINAMNPLTGQLPDLVMNLGKGAVKMANDTLGDPLKGGDVVGRAAIHAYNRPIDTAMTVIPMVKGIQSLTKPNISNQLPSIDESAAPKGGIINDIKGRAATSIGVVDPQSVVKSEAMLKEALQMTKSLTKRGMAKDLENFTPVAGKAIDNYLNIKDQQMGVQPLEPIKDTLREKLEQTSAGQANPELVNQVLKDLDKRASTEALSGDLQKISNSNFGTTNTALNEMRKTWNGSLSKWFKNGQPEASLTDNLNSLKWEASNTLKDILGESDSTGQLKDLIHQQHVALATSPVLSKLALTVPVSHSVWQQAYNTIHGLLNGVGEPIKISVARLMQGKGTNPLNAIQDAIQDATQGEMSGAIPAMDLPQGISRRPLESNVMGPITNAINTNRPAQSVRLNSAMLPAITRAEQENYLRAATKRKYK